MSAQPSITESAKAAGVTVETYADGKAILAAVKDGRLPASVLTEIRSGEKDIEEVAEGLRAATAMKARRTPINRTSPVKRRRRCKPAVESVLRAAQKILKGYEDRVTIRHLFYRLVGVQAIAKTEREYQNLCALLAKWRRSGDIAYTDFIDGTRFYYGPTLFNDAQAALENTVECYRKNLWATQPHYAEIWVEKDAISSIVAAEAGPFGVRTFVCRGFPSITALHDAAQTFIEAQQAGKEVHLFYFGDHDPSGLCIDRSAARALEHEFGVTGIDFQRVAVTPEQIEELNLPTRPAKASTHGLDWEGGCVEIDTMTPTALHDLVNHVITSLIDVHQWQMSQKIEQAEQETLRQVAAALP
jgi:hypothetical protein